MADELDPVVLVDYTEAFNIQRTIRKLGSVYIPLREGLRVSDIKMFGIAAAIWIISWSVILNPILRAFLRPFGLGTPTGLSYLAILIVPPLIVALASRKPVKHHLTMLAAMRLWLLDFLDDPIHYRGQPARAEATGSVHYTQAFFADPAMLPEQGRHLPLPNGWGGLVAPSTEPIGAASQEKSNAAARASQLSLHKTLNSTNTHPFHDVQPGRDVMVIRARRE